MNMRKLAFLPTIVLLGGAALTVVVHADNTATAAGDTPSLSATPGSPDDPNEIICHKGEPVTGTRFPARSVCHTRKEWKDIQQRSRDELMRVQTDAGAAPGMSN